MAQVDVITPVFNTPLRFLTVALDSLRAQTFTDWNAWIINDASDAAYTEKLEATLKAYADPRFHYLYSDHKGPAGSRNVGIVEGKAPYVAFLDSDDCWMPELLARHVAALESDAGVVLVHGHYEQIDEDGRRCGSVPPRQGLNDLGVPQLFAAMLRGNFVATSSVVVRRNSLEQVGGFDETFPCLVDKELWLRLLNAGAGFRYDPAVVFQYRIHAQNISKKTDLLLATRRRIIAKAERLVGENSAFAGIDWPSQKREMEHHMNREAAAVYLERGEFVRALKYSSPFHAGVSRESLLLFARSLYRSLRGFGRRSGAAR